jgi:MFS family permease
VQKRNGANATLALIAAAIGLLAVTMGARSVFGLFLSPLNSATGLGIATISFAVAVSQLTWGAAQPFCGMLAERYGPVRVIFAGTLLSATTSALIPFAHDAVWLIAVFAVAGIAATAGSPSLLVGTVSQRVSAERRGLVAGIIGAGGPLGQLVLAPATQTLISLVGWINAALAVSALYLAALPLAFVFRTTNDSGRAANVRPTGSLTEALANPHYWIINATFFICGLHVFFLVTHFPGVIELCGLPAAVSGMALAVLGLFNIAGSVAAGFVVQRYSMRGTLATLFIARMLAIGLFLVAPKTAFTILAFSAWMGLTYMAVLPPTAGLIGKLFGADRLPTLLGITFVVHQAGAFLGTWLGGVILERTGSYDGMWILDLTLAALAAVFAACVRDGTPTAVVASRAILASRLVRQSGSEV